MSERQRPLELIHARNLVTGLSTPAFLVDADGELAFYNDAAAAIIGRRFEEVGPSGPNEWTQAWEAWDMEGEPLSAEEFPLSRALAQARPALASIRVRHVHGDAYDIRVSAIPIVTSEGTHGALALFWPVDREAD
jgi:PAS domain-containing protein